MVQRKTGRRGRGALREERRAPAAAPLPQGKLRVPVLDTQAAAKIHEVTLRILWEIGAAVDDRETRSGLLTGHGCRERDHGRIAFPEDLVARILEGLPERVLLYDQDGRVAVDTGEKTPRFCPGHNCVNVLDHITGEHRPGLLEDIVRAAKVAEALSNIDCCATLGYPNDVPAEEEALSSVRAMMTHSKKPFVFTAHDEVIAERIWDAIAAQMGGWNRLSDKPIGLDLTGPVSPLKLGEELCRRLKLAARNNLPVVCYPALFPGMAGPISLAGAIAQSSAETLAGVVIHQLENPGAPILSGSAILPMDMRRADLAYGSPEYMLANLGASDYFNYIGLPNWVGGGCSDAHVPDLQAAAEVGANLSQAVLAGTPFIHNLGFLSGGRTGSLEMLVLCDELAGQAATFAGGIAVDQDALAFEVIRRASPENAYLTDEHTMARYLTENWLPELFERSDVAQWHESGARDLRTKTRDRLADILA